MGEGGGGGVGGECIERLLDRRVRTARPPVRRGRERAGRGARRESREGELARLGGARPAHGGAARGVVSALRLRRKLRAHQRVQRQRSLTQRR